ncbi:hypothetical protein M0804_005601 [Polistes exclamans]|nr:hypothetical protein M0804_005601 [Polistes exclamans]
MASRYVVAGATSAEVGTTNSSGSSNRSSTRSSSSKVLYPLWPLTITESHGKGIPSHGRHPNVDVNDVVFVLVYANVDDADEKNDEIDD